MERQTTGVLFSYVNKSEYHKSRLPHSYGVGSKALKKGFCRTVCQLNACDIVTQDKIWRQKLLSERKCLQNWEENWSYLTNYNSKGELVEKVELPQKTAAFSSIVPNTDSGNYGNRVNTELGKAMNHLEFNFYSANRRQKQANDMVCY